MLDRLISLNFPPETPLPKGDRDCFVLKTCQRTLMVGLGETLVKFFESQHASIKEDSVLWQGPQAYGMVLEILCGLQSKIIAESEVACQFRKAYRDYVHDHARNSLILLILEKLLADAKKIRTYHLKEIGKQSYGGIVRKILLTQQNQKGCRLLIKGSGALAEQIAKLVKKSFLVYISARNVEALAFMTESYGLSPLRWGEVELYKEFPLIINTIGSEDILFSKEFFSSWRKMHQQPLYIDMGSPTSIDTELEKNEGLWCLEDVLRVGEEWAEDSKEKVENAREAIQLLLLKRCRSFGVSYSQGREELHFA